MPLSGFHPAVVSWFSRTLGEPTPAQAQGWAAIRDGRHTLIAAPTGSGKTLAAFLTALDDLLVQALKHPLPDEVRVIYISPLKALSADIHKNLVEPRRGIAAAAEALGLEAPLITVAVRTGDTTPSERAAMLRKPPHVLVTTPESLYLLLTASRSRDMLRTARTVIVDEIHAVIGTRRGAHLALSLERLQQIATNRLLRLGLSATQKPIADVARYLVGAHADDTPCAIINHGHRRAMDLGVEMPGSALDAVMSHEVWEEYYTRLTTLIAEHRTTLVFVNTRKMAERLARHLSERLGEDAVTAHHGSLSKEKRLDAETRLKNGELKALVATASLELGIDIGHVDLVCQIGSPHRIATLLQRVGRSGHTVTGLPKGRVFPESRDDLIECAALLRSVWRGELDTVVNHDAPLDVLAQQVIAETACADYAEDELFDLVKCAWPFRALQRTAFDAVVRMAAEGFATKRGRRGALIHRDEVNGRLRGRRGARGLAITSGGAIPEVADYRVVLDPDDTFIGTLNEDFAIESSAGDVFQLGNASWQVMQVGPGIVRVADAKGAPPTIPFWLGEAPARSNELSRAVSDLRAEIDRMLGAETVARGFPALSDVEGPAPSTVEGPALSGVDGVAASFPASHPAIAWLIAETGLSDVAAEQAVAYLADARSALGVLPTQDTIVLERFFDESGGMQLVLHAPFGSRINKAWGLALRKRFCRQFNFELQAAATEDGLLLSLGPQHSFPLADVFRYLHPATARDVLVQAFLDAPVFQTRWRWNTTISLAVPRNRNGKKVAPQLQRMMADDLMATVFPDAAACLENIPGDRVIPDHPLVQQAVHDCLQEAMDYDGLAATLERIHRGDIRCVACDTTEPSPLSHEILNARPYAFLDDAPLEERRAHAVYVRRASEPGSAGDLGALDAAAIERVCDEERPDPRDADELHDILLTAGFLTDAESAHIPRAFFGALIGARRATRATFSSGLAAWVAAERLPELLAVCPDLALDADLTPPPSRTSKTWTREDAVTELLRGRLALSGPTTASELARPLGITTADADAALQTLESEGVVLRGRFRPNRGAAFAAHGGRDFSPADLPSTDLRTVEWCDRRLLARIHRYTLQRLRAEIEPVSPAGFMRFLFDWQHVASFRRRSGTDGLLQVIRRLDGFELAAGAWESSILPSRMDRYDPSMLDMLCLTGQVGWARLSKGPSVSRLVRSTPVALFLREHAEMWSRLAASEPESNESDSAQHAASGDLAVSGGSLSVEARGVLETLRSRGASFAHELSAVCNLRESDLRRALGELVSAGHAASDGFAGLRGLVTDRKASSRESQTAGRWASIAGDEKRARPFFRHGTEEKGLALFSDAAAEVRARALLERYGVICRRMLTRESNALPWRTLARVYRRLEARGEIRGGRFVSGLSGEQFALPEAVERLREVRRTPADGRVIVISAADPLNLAGIVTAGDRVPAVAATRVAYRDGVPLAMMEGDYIRPLTDTEPAAAAEVASALAGRSVPAIRSGFVGRTG